MSNLKPIFVSPELKQIIGTITKMKLLGTEGKAIEELLKESPTFIKFKEQFFKETNPLEVETKISKEEIGNLFG